MALLHVTLIATLSCLVTLSSASFFLLRQPNTAQDSKQQNLPSQNTVILPPSLANMYSNNNNGNNYINPNLNNNINDNFVDDITTTTTTTTPEKPPVTNINQRCIQRSIRDFRPHPHECGKFTLCSAGNLLSFDCPQGSVFHEDSKSCVPQGSFYDTCTPNQATHLICPRGATVKKAHPQECAQYYHCGEPAQEPRWENHLKECDYPMLFNDQTGRCEHYNMVTCGHRREPFDPCEYKANECGSPHCVPCNVRHPSCRGKKNGMNAWKGREGSPHFVVCAAERVVYNGMCPQSHGTQVFDDNTGSCRMLRSGQRW